MKKYLSRVLILMALFSFAFTKPRDIQLTAEESECLQRLIYLNECSGKPENLISWRDDEAFPSLGIGHFIWYPVNGDAPFRESFPDLLLFLQQNGVEIPAWIEKRPPWRNREEFEKDFQSERMISLRAFLNETKTFQVQFIVNRMKNALPEMLEATSKEKRSLVEKKFYLVANTPNGMFAMIDYVNFKGEGTSLRERLQGQGWGLLQVLEEMQWPVKESDTLSEFVHAAERILEKRVESGFAKKDETRSLKGWKKRVHNYLKITC